MGQAILYCFRCATQLRDVQFEQGKAYRLDNWVVCAACAPEALKTLPPESVQRLLDMISGKDTRKNVAAANRKTGHGLPSVKEAIRESSRAMPTTGSSTPIKSDPDQPRNPWILVGAVGGAIVIFVLLVLMSRGPNPEVVKEIRMPQPRTGGAPLPVPPETNGPAAIALKRAAKFAQDYPDDLDGQIREYSDLALMTDKGDFGAEARRKVEMLKVRDAELVKHSLERMERELADPLRQAKFSDALRIIDAAKVRIESTAGKLAMEKRASEIRDLAAAAKRAALMPPPPPPPPPPAARSVEARAYDAHWAKAVARASRRDYAGSAAELEKDLAAINEDALKGEAAQDVADLKELARAVQSTIAGLAGARSIDLKVASGRVLSVDVDRVELFSEPKKPTGFVEWLDVRAAEFVPLLKQQATDVRIPALFAILDGDVETAKGVEGIAAKYWALKAAPSKAPADEAAARELFYMAERDWRGMETREKSIEDYKALKAKHADTSVVRHQQMRIDRRADFGKEYLFLTPDIAYAGTFAPYKDERLESIADSDPSQATRNWAEWEYYPLPSATYHCWVLVGGCCSETFTFYWQSTGLVDVNPKTKKKTPADPGGGAAIETRPPVKGLKPTHPKDEPKKPVRWEWVELPIPKISAPGTRRVRILTDQRGFAISTVVVSATRTKPPTDAELAEMTKARALDATPLWALDRPGNSPRVLIDDFEDGKSGWVWVGGGEFPGAAGSYAVDSTVGRDSKGSGKIVADFTGGGAYVGGWRDLTKLPERNFKELRFWIKAPNLTGLGIRLVDSSDQLHQRHIKVTPSPDWQEVVLKPGQIAGGEHWGGANDGVWHAPFKALGINIGKGSFTQDGKQGDLWLDDLQGIPDIDTPK
ncbi:MAG TPA: hypothetical protein VE981_09945 [Planctomycetota bacterium]|nr:hypothetical protein [Planctomycetota bacterium]